MKLNEKLIKLRKEKGLSDGKTTKVSKSNKSEGDWQHLIETGKIIKE